MRNITRTSNLGGRGRLLIIGGNEDRQGECLVLRRFLTLAGGVRARIVVVTTATDEPAEAGTAYQDTFRGLGVKRVSVAALDTRESANGLAAVELVEEATGVFYTGGDQLQITSVLGGTAFDKSLRNRLMKGVVIGGTSAGAAAMSSTMIVEGDGEDGPKKCTVKMAPGMAYLLDTVIDQHFAQRGRIGRLLAALAENPGVLGIGIDENTAVEVGPDGILTVVGGQTVTILDGTGITHTNASHSASEEPLALTSVTLHVLPSGYSFDTTLMKPVLP